MTPVATEKSIHEHVSTFHKTFFNAAAMRKAAPLIVIRCNEGDGYSVVRASARINAEYTEAPVTLSKPNSPRGGCCAGRAMSIMT
jgi:hypothetical protein